jgi:hypothetical protein
MKRTVLNQTIETGRTHQKKKGKIMREELSSIGMMMKSQKNSREKISTSTQFWK